MAKGRPLDQPFLIQHKAFDNKLIQGFRSPNAKLRGLLAVHTITHCNDGIEMVEIKLSLNIPLAFLLNYSNFSNSSIFL